MNAQGAILTEEEAKANVLKSGNLRKAWYEAHGHMHTLRNCAEILEDKRMSKDVQSVLQMLGDLYDHLEENYKWD
jgi:hypothetical protein